MSADTRPEDQRIDMGALLGAVFSRWLRILIVTLVALGVTYAILLFVPKMYESTAGLLVEQRTDTTDLSVRSGSSTPSIPVEAMMSSQIELIKSRDEVGHVWEALKQMNQEPDPKSVRPNEMESRVGAVGFDGAKGDEGLEQEGAGEEGEGAPAEGGEEKKPEGAPDPL